MVWRVVYLLILASWCYLYFGSGEVGGSLYPDLMGLQYVDPDPAFHDPDPDPPMHMSILLINLLC